MNAKGDKKKQIPAKDTHAKRASVQKAQELKKKALIDALAANLGNVSKACGAVGISRKTYYEYLKDAEFQSDVDDVSESNIDFAESKLFELIEGVSVESKADEDGETSFYKQPPNVTATIFYLKTKGKKRGYVEKSEIERGGTVAVQQKEQDLSKLSLDELLTLKAIQEKLNAA